MAANPRKFSEKIALHNQKQAEETAAFEQIMREVIGATRGPTYPKSPQHLHISSSMVCRAGSLPNVNQIGQSVNKSAIDLQSALNNLEDIKHGRDDRMGRRNLDQKRVTMSPNSATYLSPPPDTSWRRTNSDSALHQSALMSTNQQLEAFQNSISRRSTFHDMDNTSMSIDDSGVINSWDPGKDRYDKYALNAPLPDHSRPKSCEVPGIMICPTQEDYNFVNNHMPHIPISSNTGSLPDLTSLHFPAPLSTPIDVDDQNANIQPNSPYQSGPDSPYSPHSPHSNANLSPSPPMAIHQINNNMLYQSRTGGGVSSISEAININNSNHRQMSTSPGPSPSPTSSRRRHHHNINNLVIGNPRHQHHTNGLHSQTGLTLDTSALTLNGNSQNYVTSSGGPSMGYSPSEHYQSLHHQSQNYVPSVPPQAQPKPQTPLSLRQTNSPLQHMTMGLHRSTTPSDHSCSAPASPVSHNISPISSPGLPNNNLSKSPFTDNSYFNVQQTSVLQQQLEQFRMVNDKINDSADHYLMMPNNGTVHSSSSSASSSTGVLYMSASAIPSSPRGTMTDTNATLNEYSPQHTPHSPQSLVNNCANSHQSYSQSSNIYYTSSSSVPLNQSPTLAYSKSVISSVNQYQQSSASNQPQTPQTPTSIPDIILTGPNIEDPLLRGTDFAKDIGTAMAGMSGSFDSDLFPSAEEAIRAGLDPIDFDGLQILPDIDSSNEETFRLERS
ncbi:CREB-regulated transcription coactivator 3-like isoform X2 [Oppia nitens]|uniref:CREB-regulated transcription coactivator 3-like isoform X2 n=1 Tax=Oppia nitens TaxID=1686743 RepID=UPI0023DC2721|nr:CREB-regulated transcription coactivator 3-like isoform X2 [Oppia nitens]